MIEDQLKLFYEAIPYDGIVEERLIDKQRVREAINNLTFDIMQAMELGMSVKETEQYDIIFANVKILLLNELGLEDE